MPKNSRGSGCGVSSVIPLLARIYPNGSADVNHFHAAAGRGFTIASLLDSGLLHEDVQTVVGPGLRRYTQERKLDDEGVMWLDGTTMPRHLGVARCGGSGDYDNPSRMAGRASPRAGR